MTVFQLPPRRKADPEAPNLTLIKDEGQDDRENTPAGPPWPVLPEAAKYGPGWQWVELMLPHTEADPAAMLMVFLAVAGCHMGSGRYLTAGWSRHPGKVWPLIVGSTASGAKGTAIAVVKGFWRRFDKRFASMNTTGGLSTGEGLIRAVRDPNGDDPDAPGFDEGVSDKRLWVDSPEFAGVLSKMRREGNVLSEVLRQAYDDEILRNLTSSSPLQATDSHIVITPQITPEELVATLAAVDAANGFGNRFMIVCSKRSKYLPEGSRPADSDLRAFDELFEQSRRAVELSTRGTPYELTRDKAARELWAAEYRRRFGVLDTAKESIAKALLSRWHANSARLSVIYALLDGELTISERHVQAALGCWDYVEASTTYVFGAVAGDRDLGRLIEFIDQSETGVSRKAISVELFQRHRTKAELDALIDKLIGLGRYEAVVVPPEGGKGRPATLYCRERNLRRG